MSNYAIFNSKGIDPRRAAPRRQPPGPWPMHATNDHSIECLVSEFITRYLRPHRKRPEYAEAILAKDVLPKWKGRDARTIEPAEVLELLDGIVERGSKVMANRTAALLGQLFKFGIHRHIVRATPVQLLFRPGGKEKPRKRTLSEDELKAYLADPTASTRYERLSHVIAILLLTGQRHGELAGTQWSQIDRSTRRGLATKSHPTRPERASLPAKPTRPVHACTAPTPPCPAAHGARAAPPPPGN